MKSPYIHLGIWICICGVTLLGYWFCYTAVTDKSSAVAALQEQINTKTETSLRVAAARTALAEISGDESLVQSYFVPDTSVVPFINDLESRARALSAVLKVLSVSTSGSAKQSNLSLLFSITVDGTFDAVMRTVGAIEFAPYDISISNVSISKNGKSSWHAALQLIIGSVPASTTATSTVAAPSPVSSTHTLYEHS